MTVIEQLEALWRAAMPKLSHTADDQVRADMELGSALRRSAPDLLALARAAEAQDHVSRMGSAWTLAAAAQARKDPSDALVPLRREVPS